MISGEHPLGDSIFESAPEVVGKGKGKGKQPWAHNDGTL